jgi:hypothetical protein
MPQNRARRVEHRSVMAERVGPQSQERVLDLMCPLAARMPVAMFASS